MLQKVPPNKTGNRQPGSGTLTKQRTTEAGQQLCSLMVRSVMKKQEQPQEEPAYPGGRSQSKKHAVLCLACLRMYRSLVAKQTSRSFCHPDSLRTIRSLFGCCNFKWVRTYMHKMGATHQTPTTLTHESRTKQVHVAKRVGSPFTIREHDTQPFWSNHSNCRCF